ncbi:sarcoglycan [Holotrichia oblita]|uniref:Sarcoglycan n=1 Tax=Holotrichia oblita TaxID=644536 RepID=A0ACB9T6I5_HOLOL|nr:sarcoglycan [Holotrichia oblita]
MCLLPYKRPNLYICISGNDRFECLANNFKIVDDKGNVLFSANDNEITVGAHVLRVTGIGGTMFKGSVQTPLVRTDSSHGLRLESPTSSLEVRGPSGIVLESRAGSIKTLSLNDIQLKSEAGEIKLESSSILMPTLPTAIPSTRVSQTRNHDIFQLCVCNNGKLFMTPPHSTCAAEESSISTPADKTGLRPHPAASYSNNVSSVGAGTKWNHFRATLLCI